MKLIDKLSPGKILVLSKRCFIVFSAKCHIPGHFMLCKPLGCCRSNQKQKEVFHCYHLLMVCSGMYTTRCVAFLSNQVWHFPLSVTSRLPQIYVCSIRPHLPPTDDFGDGCHGDTSNAADELMGCICLSFFQWVIVVR